MTTENHELDHLVDTEQTALPSEDPVVTLALPVSAVNIIFGSLQELPHRVVDPVIRNIFEQCQSQLQR